MNKKRPSLKEIAKELNVSITTVSFVLNGKGKEMHISDEVIEKIQNYTKKVDYRLNPLAQSLRTGKTQILVFMVEDISNHFFAKIARLIEDIAYKRGYKVLFCSTENKDSRAKELIRLFYERRVDGFIISPSPGIHEEIRNLVNNNIPVVLFDRYLEELETSYVGINNYKASYQATEHLIDRGYRNIGFITISSDQNQMRDREKGFIHAMTESNLNPHILKITFNTKKKIKVVKEIKDFISNKENNLDAVFFATNYLTLDGLKAIKEMKNIYDEIGIITFDDNDYFSINNPSITAVAQPLEDIAKEVMAIMFDYLESGNPEEMEACKTILKTTLKIRDSSKEKEPTKKE